MLAESVLANYKSVQKDNWGLFAPLEILTTVPAGRLVEFAMLNKNQKVLDVGCGTGVVALTTARLGCNTTGLDLSPALIERAKENASIAELEIDFSEGDAEMLPYDDNSFDVVLSQFGHMFAPRPDVTIKEMLRVLKPGGRIAFSTWPPDLYMGRMFDLVRQYSPVPEGIASPIVWGDPSFVKQKLADHCQEILFDTGEMVVPALSMKHYLRAIEKTVGPVLKLVQDSQQDGTKLERFRRELSNIAGQYYKDNYIHANFLMTRAIKAV